jgi:hypothetical protein
MRSDRVQASGHLVEKRLDEIEGVRKCVNTCRMTRNAIAMTGQMTIANNNAHATTRSCGIDRTHEQ